MYRKHSLYFLFLIQTIIVVLFVTSLITSTSTEKLEETTVTDEEAGNKKEISKQEADILSLERYFQDIFSEHVAPLQFEFGHVYENPNEWEQRFERKDFDNNRHSGKIKWGNKNGEYGEQYWDLNH